MLSKALCISQPRSKTLREQISAACIMLAANLILSVICLDEINLVCSGPISVDMMGASLSDNTRANILVSSQD